VGLVMAQPHRLPDHRFQRAQSVVLKILGQSGVVRDDQRQSEHVAIIDAGDAQAARIGDMNQVGGKREPRMPCTSAPSNSDGPSPGANTRT
jgi:hypothetical protein